MGRPRLAGASSGPGHLGSWALAPPMATSVLSWRWGPRSAGPWPRQGCALPCCRPPPAMLPPRGLGLGTPQVVRLHGCGGLDPPPAPCQPWEMPIGGDGNSQSTPSPGGSPSCPLPALTSPLSLQVCQCIRRFCPRRGHLHGPGSLTRRLLPAPLQHVRPEVGIASPGPLPPQPVPSLTPCLPQPRRRAGP